MLAFTVAISSHGLLPRLWGDSLLLIHGLEGSQEVIVAPLMLRVEPEGQARVRQDAQQIASALRNK